MPVVRCLADGILLGVYAKAFVEVLSAFRFARATRTASSEAVFDAARGSVVSGGDYVVGLHYHRSYLTARTVGAQCYDFRNLHEIFIPAGTRIYGVLLFHARILAYFAFGKSLCIKPRACRGSSFCCHPKLGGCYRRKDDAFADDY